jgi:hypothetical protein
MPSGNVNDPRMNSIEMEFGTLTTTEIGDDGRSKTIIYLKDEVSRTFTFGTPVEFDLETRTILYSNSSKDKFATIEVATNVRLDTERIKKHPIIHRLNLHAKEILPRD